MTVQRKTEQKSYITLDLVSDDSGLYQSTDSEPSLPQDPEALLTETQASLLSGLSIRWYQKKRQVGGGPKFVRISSRCVRYRRKDLLAYFEERLATSTSDIF